MSTDFVATVVLLVLLLDPLGNIPFILSLLKPLHPARRRLVLVRENAAAALILVVSVYAGDWVLHALRLSSSALEISGGLILVMIAVRMVFPARGDEPHNGALDTEPLIVPIAIPMIAGPAALATVLLTARQAEHRTTLVLAIAAAMVVNFIILLSAGQIARLFGSAGMAAMERLMGLLLTAMAVQMLISGIHSAFLVTG